MTKASRLAEIIFNNASPIDGRVYSLNISDIDWLIARIRTLENVFEGLEGRRSCSKCRENWEVINKALSEGEDG